MPLPSSKQKWQGLQSFYCIMKQLLNFPMQFWCKRYNAGRIGIVSIKSSLISVLFQALVREKGIKDFSLWFLKIIYAHKQEKI